MLKIKIQGGGNRGNTNYVADTSKIKNIRGRI